ncbi:hypothetical protein [Rhizobium bangladeshense]|uniref:hypothetical protein n=1 Tax=Rhizobium bangladeshense TaxID=1138189 RepID=UPI0012E78BFA|nr:hypothetical protein [Rhizobium bangladeshense]
MERLHLVLGNLIEAVSGFARVMTFVPSTRASRCWSFRRLSVSAGLAFSMTAELSVRGFIRVPDTAIGSFSREVGVIPAAVSTKPTVLKI